MQIKVFEIKVFDLLNFILWMKERHLCVLWFVGFQQGRDMTKITFQTYYSGNRLAINRQMEVGIDDG